MPDFQLSTMQRSKHRLYPTGFAKVSDMLAAAAANAAAARFARNAARVATDSTTSPAPGAPAWRGSTGASPVPSGPVSIRSLLPSSPSPLGPLIDEEDDWGLPPPLPEGSPELLDSLHVPSPHPAARYSGAHSAGPGSLGSHGKIRKGLPGRASPGATGQWHDPPQQQWQGSSSPGMPAPLPPAAAAGSDPFELMFAVTRLAVPPPGSPVGRRRPQQQQQLRQDAGSRTDAAARYYGAAGRKGRTTTFDLHASSMHGHGRGPHARPGKRHGHGHGQGQRYGYGRAQGHGGYWGPGGEDAAAAAAVQLLLEQHNQHHSQDGSVGADGGGGGGGGTAAGPVWRPGGASGAVHFKPGQGYGQGLAAAQVQGPAGKARGPRASARSTSPPPLVEQPSALNIHAMAVPAGPSAVPQPPQPDGRSRRASGQKVWAGVIGQDDAGLTGGDALLTISHVGGPAGSGGMQGLVTSGQGHGPRAARGSHGQLQHGHGQLHHPSVQGSMYSTAMRSVHAGPSMTVSQYVGNSAPQQAGRASGTVPTLQLGMPGFAPDGSGPVVPSSRGRTSHSNVSQKNSVGSNTVRNAGVSVAMARWHNNRAAEAEARTVLDDFPGLTLDTKQGEPSTGREGCLSRLALGTY